MGLPQVSLCLSSTDEGGVLVRQPPWEYNGNISQLRTLNPYVTYGVMYKLLQLNASSRV